MLGHERCEMEDTNARKINGIYVLRRLLVLALRTNQIDEREAIDCMFALDDGEDVLYHKIDKEETEYLVPMI